MQLRTDEARLDAVLTRGVARILPSKDGLRKLLQSRRIRLHQGFDATGGRLHLGHTIGLRKLMEFAELGHDAIFLFGTGTVLVGDPSQRASARTPLKEEDIQANIKTWKKQVQPIVDFQKVTVKENGEWLNRLRLKDVIGIASQISAVQLFKRDMFRRRIAAGDTVWYHETMYPLLQGYDSVVLDVDLEIGGTDQEFNMLIGRELLWKMRGKEKFILTVPMILGTDGKPMSKTSGNCVWLDDTPDDMYGKLLRIPDSQIAPYAQLLTDIPEADLKRLGNQPLEAKKRLAFEITAQFHGKRNANQAQANFKTVFQRGELPETVIEVSFESGLHTLLEICQGASLGVSSSQMKRTIRQGGVAWQGTRISDPGRKLVVRGGEVLKFGKRTFRKIKV